MFYQNLVPPDSAPELSAAQDDGDWFKETLAQC